MGTQVPAGTKLSLFCEAVAAASSVATGGPGIAELRTTDSTVSTPGRARSNFSHAFLGLEGKLLEREQTQAAAEAAAA